MNKRQKKQLSPEMIENQSRREFILRALRTSGGLGLYSILLNLPPAFLLKGAMAAETAKYLIFSEHRGACPLNANVPGTYVSGVRHPTGVAFAAADIILGNTTLQGNRQGAAVWNDLDPEIRARLHFTHHSTRENNHSRSIEVMSVKGAVKNEEGRATEVIPSAIAQETAATLGTSQIKPIGFDGVLEFKNIPEGIIRPKALKALFDNNLSTTEKQIKDIRDALLDSVYQNVKENGSKAQKTFLDNHVISRNQAALYTANLGNYLSSVSANQTEDKIIAAVALMKIGATPCTRLGFKFGDDNHKDLDLVTESQQTINSIADMNFLWNELKSVNMEDQVVFALINVFGRTLEDKRPGNGNDKGRDHNLDHNVGLVFGPGVKPGVSGGLDAAAQNRKAAAFNSGNGGLSNPDISYGESHASLAKTIFALCGVNEERIKTRVTAGKIIDNMLL